MALQGGLNILLWSMFSISKVFSKFVPKKKDQRNPLGFYEKELCQASLARNDHF